MILNGLKVEATALTTRHFQGTFCLESSGRSGIPQLSSHDMTFTTLTGLLELNYVLFRDVEERKRSLDILQNCDLYNKYIFM